MAADAKIVNLTAPKPGASEQPPREMSREDRRLIFAKLEEVYVDEATGYTKGWHDQRVAEDMAVPRAWVEEIREQNFGPIKADQSAEIIEISGRIAQFEGDHAALVLDAVALRKSGAALLASASDLSDRAEKVVQQSAELAKRLEAMRAEVRKLTGKP